MRIPAERWLGLALRSESDQPHEWEPLGWVIRNRVESSTFPSTWFGVITQRHQFSYFNDLALGDDEESYARASQGYAGDASGWPDNDLSAAVLCARALMAAPRWQAPFGPRVYNFWSPVSMRPPGRLPDWSWDRLRVFPLAGIDPWRFLFAETVGAGHPGSGRSRAEAEGQVV
ncbi:MAG TPA: cell wall hydrolase [Thermoanaerobaculia bacterium]|nr:cell wall hydrolase [Thermoanaerobaculia bacterium]